MDDEEYSIFWGFGSSHDLDDKRKEPRLWFAKSVSKAGAHGLHHRTETRIPIGFHKPPAPEAQRIERGVKIPGVRVKGKF